MSAAYFIIMATYRVPSCNASVFGPMTVFCVNWKIYLMTLTPIKTSSICGIIKIYYRSSLKVAWNNYWHVRYKSVRCWKAVTVPFSNSYLREYYFSSLRDIRTKSSNRLDVQRAMRIAISTKTPRGEVIIADIQDQQRHRVT